MQSSGDGRVPVFVFPNTITFYLEDQTTHKQILTLYNPYDFAVRFKVLSTSPRKFTVVDPEGSIRPKCCIDIVIRHGAVNLVNCQIVDKFRIQMYDFSTKQLIGRRDVTATLVTGEPDKSIPDKEFECLAAPPSTPSQPQRQYSLGHRSERPASAGPNQWFLSAVALVCIAVLCLPLEGEKSAISWPVTVNVKLVVSYVLGLVTMVIFRPA
ncbi:motile sperm domain-containing protein 1-like [Macrosteles quadrilineatus]|uniref:motile sperm domain-containing protein 1-like n=1 Tax=Macrosteles quadrilineatus TaxID=74068 RepID=UPI0023E184D2|nr:motile sperm domain-containing protein 1-like [Macrosteles quadrilineatus]XP_054268957.1 motile sperm domain-containing protein 1-like [Macrosteles quadrilineatus]